jgi:hypothetical protein
LLLDDGFGRNNVISRTHLSVGRGTPVLIAKESNGQFGIQSKRMSAQCS